MQMKPKVNRNSCFISDKIGFKIEITKRAKLPYNDQEINSTRRYNTY